MNDQWYFEIGDGQTYGPFPLEKLQKWAAAGNLMPIHRVRKADSDEWVIAAYVRGLEQTTAVPPQSTAAAGLGSEPIASRTSLGGFVSGLARKKNPAIGSAKKEV